MFTAAQTVSSCVLARMKKPRVLEIDRRLKFSIQAGKEYSVKTSHAMSRRMSVAHQLSRRLYNRIFSAHHDCRFQSPLGRVKMPWQVRLWAVGHNWPLSTNRSVPCCHEHTAFGGSSSRSWFTLQCSLTRTPTSPVSLGHDHRVLWR